MSHHLDLEKKLKADNSSDFFSLHNKDMLIRSKAMNIGQGEERNLCLSCDTKSDAISTMLSTYFLQMIK